MWGGLRERLAEGFNSLIVAVTDEHVDVSEWNPSTERKMRLLLRLLKTLKVRQKHLDLREMDSNATFHGFRHMKRLNNLLRA